MADFPRSRVLLSTAAFFARPLREGLRLIAEAGYEGVEVMVTKDTATQEPHQVAALAREFGLDVEAVHAPFLLMTRKVFGTDPVGKIYRSVHLAEEIGARLVVVHPPYRWQPAYRRWLHESLPDFVTTTGVQVAVENMFPLRLPRERSVTFHGVHPIEEVERFDRVVLDTSHAAVAGLDLLETRERLGARLAHVHLSNNAGRGWDSHLPVDEGVLPVGEFLDAVAADGFRGAVSLELDVRPYLHSEEATLAVLRWNREFCEERLHVPAPPSRLSA
jgi:sugar phosphate isomerase/epimerase